MAKESLKKIEQIAGLGKADLHVHLINSKPEELLDYVQNKTDLDVIAITDHDSIENALRVKEEWQGMGYRFEIIVGEEIAAKEGHVVGIFLKETVPSNLTVHETTQKIHEQGGLAIAAHPFQSMPMRRPKVVLMDGIGLKCLLKEGKNFDAIEVVNATPTLADENLRASILNKTILLKAEVGSSDAHIPEVIGKGYTVFKGKTAADLRRAIEMGQTQAIRDHWNLTTLLKYGFFFLPEGLRIAFYNLTHILHKSRPHPPA
ncbi:MAG: PHP-associated domain-containing protein [Candidatus Pacebacteria bacterium]|nr:PHP-associated domain-containing protein [Candidatus Paceibacterota bacterium]